MGIIGMEIVVLTNREMNAVLIALPPGMLTVTPLVLAHPLRAVMKQDMM
jgi:hypothetical protein